MIQGDLEGCRATWRKEGRWSPICDSEAVACFSGGFRSALVFTTPRQDVDRATSQLEASLTSPTDPDLIHVASLVLCRDMQTDDVDAYWAQLCRVSQLLEASRLLEQAQVVFVAQGVLPLCKTRVEPPKDVCLRGFCMVPMGRGPPCRVRSPLCVREASDIVVNSIDELNVLPSPRGGCITICQGDLWRARFVVECRDRLYVWVTDAERQPNQSPREYRALGVYDLTTDPTECTNLWCDEWAASPLGNDIRQLCVAISRQWTMSTLYIREDDDRMGNLCTMPSVVTKWRYRQNGGTSVTRQLAYIMPRPRLRHRPVPWRASWPTRLSAPARAQRTSRAPCGHE